ncbi:MAG: AAA family ATPase, partial [bacterium]|nr:AAA family ATPase [bacterium]
MVNLFDIENPASGFRLETLEMFNWGTFDQKIWCIRPKGRNSLLTGANGSGKTTLVDAIVSLLVPPARRYYNQSSGTQRKNERNEISYVKGAYKTLQYEGELSAKTQYLRTTDDFSIILGVFLNQDMKASLSLAQVRWFANNEL